MIRLFNVSIPTAVIMLVVSDTILIAACYLVVALFALDELTDPWIYFRYNNGWLQLTLVVSVLQIGMYLLDLYDDVRLRSRALLIQQLILLLGISFLIQAGVGYSRSTLLQLPRWTMLYGSALVLVAIPTWRTAFFSLIRNTLPNKKALFLGASPEALELIEAIEARPDLGYTVVGYLSPDDHGGRRLGGFDNIEEIVRLHKPNLVLISREWKTSGQLPLRKLMELRMRGTRMVETTELYEMIFGRICLQDLPGAELLFSSEFQPKDWTLRLQRVLSLVFGLVGLVVFLPVMVLVFIAVKLTSPGPAIYRQQRVGQNQVPFYLYKFRSMHVNAETGSGPVWAAKNDPRITPLGRWLRLLRLDELPQFINVIRGEMAIAGPRPERPEFCAVLAEKIPFYHQRHVVKPGITGWAQINHKYTETVEEASTKLEFDLYYVKHLTPALDLYIVFHTVKVMLLLRGAQ